MSDWLRPFQSPDIYPLDEHDTEIGPHALRSPYVEAYELIEAGADPADWDAIVDHLESL